MKKFLLAAAALLSISAVAQAQSSVTLYGRIDSGLEYMNGVPSGTGNGTTHRLEPESGDWGTSLWGIKGAEDLGGGNRAVFHLEGSFNAMNGNGPSGNRIFNRWAEVGFANDSYGKFMMGRQLFISNDVWDFDPFGQSNWSSASLVRNRNWPQSSNNVSYQSPKFAGFDFHGQYALSNSTSWNGGGTTDQGREAGASITYTAPLFQVRGLYDEIRNPANGTLGGSYLDSQGAYAYSREYTAMVNLFLGQFKVQGAYQAIRTSGMTGTATGLPTTLDHEWGGVTWQATPAAALIAAVYHVNGNNGAGNATLYSIGGSYNLSKRTLFDMQFATVRNSKTANYGLNANNVGVGASTDNPFPGHSQTGVYAGIQHSF
jgi:predicted porin